MQSPPAQSTALVPSSRLPSVSDILNRPTLNLDKDEIRILTLYPGRWPDSIRCSLRTVRLEDDPHFEALSYAWGDPDIRRPIFLDDCVHYATANLVAALRRLRHLDRVRHLWVDALCINQKDDAEKTHQVNLMSQIYSRTDEGLLWLGDYEEGSLLDVEDISADASSELGGSSTSGGEPVSVRYDSEATITRAETATAFSVIQALADGNHWETSFETLSNVRGLDSAACLNSLLDLPWWGRIWTVQESVLPRTTTIICGSLQMPFSTCSRALDNIFTHQSKGCCLHSGIDKQVLRRFADQIGAVEMVRNNPDTQRRFQDALLEFRYRIASDPRDKVYALLGLLDHRSRQQLSIRPDYSSHWHQVYQQAVLQLITTTKSLRILSAPAGPTRDRRLPSWVPDLNERIASELRDFETFQLCLYPVFNCSLNSEVVLGDSSELELVLKGTKVDRVRLVGEIAQSTVLMAEFPEYVTKWCKLLEANMCLQDLYPLGGTCSQAFSRLLGYDVVVDGNKFRRLGALDAIWHINGSTWRAKDFESTSSIPPVNQRFFITEKGLIGTGSPNIGVGDLVYIEDGGRMPMVLRSVRQVVNRKYFEYQGFAYVHGIMDGEVAQDKSQWSWLTLV
ncbi:heterokaryon incompatibility protein-domain-containing protein [Podospora aff. communis PSN243]|uniref:Heterokaryon incompatibility protein-domain-containing protein n=1 Tax=Podospora aff. communis PSN243 TaxID=3040156 RepID=A0AAV9GDA3_9PEZI|nr:heterokaryon incompatibility protein-domain-containing protein [Podospora aff. communis PSN243]